MDLRNYQIIVGDILRYPPACEVIRRELPDVWNSPLLKLARGMTLQQVLQLAGGKISHEERERILEELQRA